MAKADEGAFQARSPARGRCKESGCLALALIDACADCGEDGLCIFHAGEHECMTWWQRFRWWWWTRVPPRRCCGCGCKMLGEDEEYDPRVEAGTHGTLERTYENGCVVCYSCVNYPEG